MTDLKPEFLQHIAERLAHNKPVRRTLPPWGRIHIDRQLPFLCVYRQLPQEANWGTDRLILGEAAYLKASGAPEFATSLSALIKVVVQTLVREFGSFLIVELWAGPECSPLDSPKDFPQQPGFRIVLPPQRIADTTLQTLRQKLSKVQVHKQPATVDVTVTDRIAPPPCAPLLSARELQDLGCHLIGLEVRPIYWDFKKGLLLPLVRRALHRGIALALKWTFFDFADKQTTHRPPHYHALGQRAMVKAVWEVDRHLSAIVNQFDFILLCSPVNTDMAWKAFKRSHYTQEPDFLYRPLPVSPAQVKKDLFNIPIQRVEDPTLADLFEEKRNELDRKLTMLQDRDTGKFLFGSLQLFGGVDEKLYRLSKELLETSANVSQELSPFPALDACALADRAEKEVSYYNKIHAGFSAKVRIRRDISGLMTVRGNLLIGSSTKVPPSRVDALLQHEVGTHLLCHYNGCVQPFNLIRCGLPGYEDLQEGLAVLSEYGVGGLNTTRLRVLAGRTLAVRRLTEGTSFLDIFHELHHTYCLGPRSAFLTTARVFRSGGLTKDAIYLRGLQLLLQYLQQGEPLETLYLGKISIEHVPIIEELQWRKILCEMPLRPRFLDDPQCRKRLERLRKPVSLIDLTRDSV